MFKNPFSFSGRIRRLEYGLTYILSFTIVLFVSPFFEISEFLDSIIVLIVLLAYWIILAQGTKRCHDIGNNGYSQLIPFYVFIMLFEEGDKKENKYGLNPKTKEYLEKKIPFKLMVSKNISHLKYIIIVTTTLFLVLILGINNLIFFKYDTYLTLSYYIMPIPGFIFLLRIIYYKKPYPIKKSSLIHQQLVFSIFYYSIIRLYNIIFRISDFNFKTIIFEFTAVVFIFGLTHISVDLYSMIFKSNSKDV